MILSTRALFPRTYEGFKQRMIDEYSQISTRKPQAVFKVIRSEEGKRYDNDNFKLEQNKKSFAKHSTGGAKPSGGNSSGASGAPGREREVPNTQYLILLPLSEAKSEQARVALEIDRSSVMSAGLADEEFGLVCKCGGDEIDLLLDTGTVSNLVPED